jgi:hypothetical protein
LPDGVTGTPNMMQAVVVYKPGAPEVLVLVIPPGQ